MLEFVHLSHIFTENCQGSRLEDFNLTIFSGEVVYLTGNYGSGKRLVKELLTGTTPIERGTLYWKEEPYKAYSPHLAYQHGIVCMDSQQRLVESLSIAENIFLLRKKRMFPQYYKKSLITRQTALLLEEFGLNQLPETKVFLLSPFEKQLLSLIKAVSSLANLIIIDCVKATYSYMDILNLQKIIVRLKEKGISFLILSEKKNDFIQIADKIVFIQKGSDSKVIYQDEFGNMNFYQHFKSQYLPPPTQKEELSNNPSYKAGNLYGILDILWDYSLPFQQYLDQLHTPFTAENLIGSVFPVLHKIHVEDMVFVAKETADYLLDNITISENLVIPVYKKISNGLGIINRDMHHFIYEAFLQLIQTQSRPQYIRELTYVQKKILAIYRWQLRPGQLLLLETPFIGLDSRDLIQFKSFLNHLTQSGVSVVIFSSNAWDLKEICSQIIICENMLVQALLNKDKFDTI